SELGRTEEARREFESLAASDFADLPRDTIWSTAILVCSEVCTYLGDTARASMLYALLEPMDRRNLLLGGPSSFVSCFGSTSRYLGLLATTLRDWEAAERHFNDAL